MRTVIGLLSDIDEAQRTAIELKKLGLRSNQISVLSTRPGAGATTADGVQLSSMDVAGLGNVTAGGPLLQYLSPSTATANPDALVATLMKMGVPQSEAVGYVQGVRNGYTLEAAIVNDDSKADEALAIMQRHAESGNTLGQQGLQSQGAVAQRGAVEGTARVPVAQEEITVGKREVSAGGIRVSTHVIEQPFAEEISLREEHIAVQRNAVDRPVANADDAFRERSFEVTATAEEAVVAKRAHVVEEVIVRKDVGTRTETIRDTVRKTDVRVEQLRAYDAAPYRQHFQQANLGANEQFEHYEPAYKFGHQLRGDERFSHGEWDRIEPDARASWEKQSPGTWDRFKASIRHAWQRATE